MNTREIFVVVRGADLCAETVAAYTTYQAAHERAIQIVADLFEDCGLDSDDSDAPNRNDLNAWNNWWDSEPDMQVFVNSVPLFE